MNCRLRTIALTCLTLLAATGCRQDDRAVFTPPTRAELPTFDQLESPLPISVGVEGAGDARGIVVVPLYEKIEPTPQEREILGYREPPEIDALVLYRPPRGPEHGVSTEVFGMLTGIGGIGGALVGQEYAVPRYGTDGFAGRHYGISLLGRSRAGAGRARADVAEAGLPWIPKVGEGRAREPAQHQSRRYR